jgi:aminoglycoside 3-N-acetyltransferase
MSSPQIATHVLTQQIRELGVKSGTVLTLHSSFKAVGAVEGGPHGLINALLPVVGPEGTLVMPSMAGSQRADPYDPRSTPTRNMGIVAETLWRMPNVLRSDHPTSAFAAVGPKAAQLAAPQRLDPVHGLDSPIGRVYTLGGWVLLLGAGQDANTTIHLAETMSRVPYTIEK